MFELEFIITNTTVKNKVYWANLTKSDKISQIRKKNSSVMHDYYAMANKYSSWDKMMFTFTVPNSVRCKGRSVKNSKYTKLRELVDIKAALAKLLSRQKGIKYFANIELGKKYSNPHLHIQFYCDSMTSAMALHLIRNKIIRQYNLNSSLCHITLPEMDKDTYMYVVKDYSKFLSDEDIWNLDVQKKRFRKALRSKIRFISKSGDRYTKRAYKIAYWSYSVLRGQADLFLDNILERFFYFNKKKLPCIPSFEYVEVKLSKDEQEGLCMWYVYTIYLSFVDVRCRSPPYLFLFYYLFKLKGVIMFIYFVKVFWFRVIIFDFEERNISPP